ncbi:MAG: hypothetical protein WC721_21925 [Victivallaceae bacterium]|jgi:hypothetical protein
MTLSKRKLKKNETLLKVFLENYNHHHSTEPLPFFCQFMTHLKETMLPSGNTRQQNGSPLHRRSRLFS